MTPDATTTDFGTAGARCPGGTGSRPAGRRRSGYVLLLTLLILALAATVTAGVSRSSFARAARSVEAERDLQRRWGAASCRNVYLPRAEQVIAAAEAAQGRPLAVARARVVLGGQAFDLAFADETAKLNVNVLVHRRGKAQAEAVVKELVRAGGSDVRPRLLAGKPQAVRPRRDTGRPGRTEAGDANGDDPSGGGADGGRAEPARRTAQPPARGGGAAGEQGRADEERGEPPAEDEEFTARPLQSFGQVFPGASPDALAGTGGRPAATALVSCWGHGWLNFRRAPDAVLRQFCPPTLTLGQTNRLIQLRQQSPRLPVASVLDLMKLKDEDARDAIEERLFGEPDCHSLWVVVTTPGRSWYHFAVDDRSGDTPVTVSFAW